MRRGAGKVDKKYGRTLFELSGAGDYDRRAAALREWLELLAGVPELRSTLDNPALPLEERLAIARDITEKCGPGDEVLKNFIAELLGNRRLGSLRGVLQAFTSLVEEARGQISVTVVSAFALGGEEREQLRRDMEGALRKNVIIEWQVDPAIIGGLIVHAGDTVLDNSLRGALQRAKKELLV